MPRKHHPKHHIPYQHTELPRKDKRRYSSEQLAKKAAEHQMLMNNGLELTIYKDIDGGWYLTRRKSDN